MTRLTRPQSLRAIFAMPASLGGGAICGLVVGLAGDGWWDAAAWVLLGLLPAAIFLAWRKRRT